MRFPRAWPVGRRHIDPAVAHGNACPVTCDIPKEQTLPCIRNRILENRHFMETTEGALPSGIAHCCADGNGNGVVQPCHHHGRLVRSYCLGSPSSDAHHRTVGIYDVLWYGSSRSSPCQQFPWTEGHRKRSSCFQCRIPHYLGHGRLCVHPSLLAKE